MLWLTVLYSVIQGLQGLLNRSVSAHAELIFTKRTDVFPYDVMKSRSHQIGCYNDRIALKFDRHLGGATAEVPVKFQSNWESLNRMSRLEHFTRCYDKTCVRLLNRGPGSEYIASRKNLYRANTGSELDPRFCHDIEYNAVVCASIN